MLKIFAPRDPKSQFCDGTNRRNFLKIGGLSAAGLSLPQLLAAESQGGHRQFAQVGHHDLPGRRSAAPGYVRSEARCALRTSPGPMRPIGTNVPGIEICEFFPQMAQTDGQVHDHSFAGRRSGGITMRSNVSRDARRCKSRPRGGWAAFRKRGQQSAGPVHKAVPPYVSMCYECTHGPYNEPGPGMLGRRPVAVPAASARPRRTWSSRHHLGPARRSQGLLRQLRRFPARGRCQRHDGRAGCLHPTGFRHSDLVQAGRRARPFQGRSQDPGTLRDAATR